MFVSTGRPGMNATLAGELSQRCGGGGGNATVDLDFKTQDSLRPGQPVLPEREGRLRAAGLGRRAQRHGNGGAGGYIRRRCGEQVGDGVRRGDGEDGQHRGEDQPRRGRRDQEEVLDLQLATIRLVVGAM